MHKGHGLSRHRLMAFAAVLVLALAVPGLAFAASFSNAKPAAGSSTTVTKPTVSVVVYDKYKVYGSGSRYMAIDGVKVAHKYSTYAGWGYKKQKIYFTPTTALSIGSHTVSVRVVNRRGTTYRYSWSFTVTDGVAPVTTSDAVLNYVDSAVLHLSASDNVGVAHTYYRLDGGPQTAGTVVNVAGDGKLHMVEFWSTDAAGNEEVHKQALFFVSAPIVTVVPHAFPTDAANLACQGSGCHAPSKFRNNVARLHEETSRTCRCHQADPATPVTKSCVECHTATPPNHAAGTHPVIASTGTPSCSQSGCHGTAVITIHTGGCAVCHDSADPAVIAAVAGGNATCESCHAGTFDSIHGTLTSFHAVSGACFNSQCHPSDAADIHTKWADPPGCVACHGPGKTPSLVCANCHSNIGTVHSFPHVNAAGTKSSACTGCHGTQLPAVHQNVGCVCHTATYLVAEMTPLMQAGTAECVDCHKDQYAAHGFDQTASGHSTSTYGYRGMREFYDGTEGATVLDTRGNPIQGEWAIPTSRVFWKPGDPNLPADAYLGADGQGLDAESEITCRDCHSGIPAETGDPHGAVVLANAGIDPDYPVPYKNAVLSHYQTNVQTFSDGTTTTLMPAKSGINYRLSWETTSTADLRVGDADVICAKCHDLWEENAAGTASADATSAAFYGFGNFAHEEHSRFNASGRGDCVNCHVAIPHGWNRPRLLIQSYSGEATQVANGTTETITVVADAYPYSNPRGYWSASMPLENGFGSFFPGESYGKRMGLALLPAVWGSNPDTARGYVAGGPGDHPPVVIGPYGEMTSSFIAPEWQERSSDCMAGCGGSLTRHPKTVQESFIK